MDTPLTTPPLPPQALAVLKQAGIHTIVQLQQYGAAAAFLLLQHQIPGSTRALLWRLHELADGLPPHSSTAEQRQQWAAACRRTSPQAGFPDTVEMQRHMTAALEAARRAAAAGEIPVGAAIVKNGHLIATAANSCIADCNIGRHAEMSVLAAAGAALGNYRLDGCDLYVTLEPCFMCAGAIIQARIGRLIYGAAEPKTGAAGSIGNLFADTRINRHTAVRGGILAEQSAALLQEFFQTKRRPKTPALSATGLSGSPLPENSRKIHP